MPLPVRSRSVRQPDRAKNGDIKKSIPECAPTQSNNRDPQPDGLVHRSSIHGSSGGQQRRESQLLSRSLPINEQQSAEPKTINGDAEVARSGKTHLPKHLPRVSSLRPPDPRRQNSQQGCSRKVPTAGDTTRARPVSTYAPASEKRPPSPQEKSASFTKYGTRGHRPSLSDYQHDPSSRGNGRPPALTNTLQELRSKPLRPQFSTYQQHFSPKKVQHSLDEKTEVHDSATASSSVPPEIVQLQNELLQLQLVHRNSYHTQKLHHLKAKATLAKRHYNLVKAHRSLVDQEQALNTELNHDALQRWSNGGERLSLTERLQTLSRCVQEMTDMIGVDPKLSRVIEQFEAWYKSITRTLHERSRTQNAAKIPPEEASSMFVQSLGDPWHDNVDTLSRKLELCCRTLESLGEAEGSLGLVLKRHKKLANNLLSELSSLMTIEGLILEQEQEWIDDSISALLDAGGSDAGSVPGGAEVPRSGIWEIG